MTLTVTYDGVDIKSLLRLEDADLALTTAADGTTAVGACHVDDIAGSMTLLPLGDLIVEESACVGATRCFTGTGLNFKINRGTNFVGAGREWDFDAFDLNELLKRRRLRGSTANRAAETGSARIAWLLTTEGMSGVVFDNGAIAANAWTYEKTDFRGKTALDVLESIVSASGELGRVFFVYWDQATSQPSLFYASPNAVLNTSTLRISNVAADVDSTTTFAPHEGSDLEAKGEEIFDGVYVVGAGTLTYYLQRASTFATYGVHVDGTFQWDRITTAAYAAVHANTFLDRHAGQIDTITLVVRLPKAKVNLIDAGMRISVKFAHLPGYTTFTWTRVTQRTLILTNTPHSYYDVQLELSTKGLDQTGGGGPSDFPHQPANASVVQYKHQCLPSGGANTITLDQAPGEGNVGILWVTRRGGSFTLLPAYTAHPSGQITPGSDGGGMGYRTIGAGETVTQTVRPVGDNGLAECFTFVELAGVATTPDDSSEADVDTGTKPSTFNLGTGLTASAAGIAVGGGAVHCSDWAGNGPTTVTPGAGWNELVDDGPLLSGEEHPLHWVGTYIASTAVSISSTLGLNGNGYNFGGWGGQTLFFPSSSGDAPPTAAQEFGPIIPVETPNGATSTFTLPAGYEFANGSLKVFVDRLDQTAAVIAYDGIARTFTLGFNPKVGELVEAYGMGR